MKLSLLPVVVLAASAFGTVAVAGITKLTDGTYIVSETVEKPLAGSSQAEVISQFGEPQVKHSPVGVPAISSWEYPHFEVYFENNLVIHAVER